MEFWVFFGKNSQNIKQNSQKIALYIDKTFSNNIFYILLQSKTLTFVSMVFPQVLVKTCFLYRYFKVVYKILRKQKSKKIHICYIHLYFGYIHKKYFLKNILYNHRVIILLKESKFFWSLYTGLGFWVFFAKNWESI